MKSVGGHDTPPESPKKMETPANDDALKAQEKNNPSATLSGDNEEPESSPLAGTSTFQKLRFASGRSGYRIVRLSMELFLILRIQELNWQINQAGLIFLVYSMASIAGSLILMWFPSLFLGNTLRALSFLVFSIGSMCAGFIFTFNVETFWSMSLFACLSGMGSAVWATNSRTITNLSYPPELLREVALHRQLFESIGFLVPSICLAIIVSLDDTIQVDEESGAIAVGADDLSGNETTSVVRTTASILGTIAALFHLLSFDQMFQGARNIRPSSGNDMSFWTATKMFFGMMTLKLVFINSIILSASNILMSTMSLITDTIFGLEPTLLWIAAIGFPLGSITSVLGQLVLSKKDKKNARSTVLAGSIQMSLFFALCLGLSPIAPPDSDKVAKTLLFAFGFIGGVIYSVTFASGGVLWLVHLKKYDTSFISRANVMYSLIMQALIAIVFQVQTSIIDAVLVNETATVVLEATVYFAPLIGFFIASWLLVRSLPFPKDDTSPAASSTDDAGAVENSLTSSRRSSLIIVGDLFSPWCSVCECSVCEDAHHQPHNVRSTLATS